MKVLVYDTHKFEIESLKSANKGQHELTFLEARLTKQTAALSAGFDAVLLFANDDASAAVVDILKENAVKHIATRSAGYNHIDLGKTRALGIRVANVPEYSPYAVAEHTVALMLALNRRLIRAQRRVRELNFSLNGLVGFDMRGKTVGIVGVGRIGLALAAILNGFGCRILACDPQEREDDARRYNIRYTDLATLYRESDIISLHAPLLAETRYLINAETIALMKRGVMLINTSRGALVDTKAVIDGLKSGRIGYVGLDVYEEETDLFFEDHSEDILQDDVIARLLTFPNVLITSHQAFLTETALENIASSTIESLNCWARQCPSPYEI